MLKKQIFLCFHYNNYTYKGYLNYESIWRKTNDSIFSAIGLATGSFLYAILTGQFENLFHDIFFATVGCFATGLNYYFFSSNNDGNI